MVLLSLGHQCADFSAKLLTAGEELFFHLVQTNIPSVWNTLETHTEVPVASQNPHQDSQCGMRITAYSVKGNLSIFSQRSSICSLKKKSYIIDSLPKSINLDK